MCCLFTCFGWTIDLIQRLWTFFMSCLISCAVCCALVIASVAGIALGYNYSLAEYIDLKETNVSVYLKRGVFDEDIPDQSSGWRRRMAEDNLEGQKTTELSGRRLDNSIYESEDHNKFEGSLMKLTAKVPYPVDSSTTETTLAEMEKFIQKFSNPEDQLKAVNTLINTQKERVGYQPNARKFQKTDDERYMDPYYLERLSDGRRVLLPNHMKAPNRTPNSLRTAVPDESMVDPVNWMLPRMQLKKGFTPDLFNPDVFDASPTFPRVPTPRPGPVRPTKFKKYKPTTSSTTKSSPQSQEDSMAKSIEEQIGALKGNLLDKKKPEMALHPPGPISSRKTKLLDSYKRDDEDYDTKGIPIRKKRHHALYNPSFDIKQNHFNNTVTKTVVVV